MKGHTWTAFLYLFGLGFVIFLPAVIVSGILGEIVSTFDSRLLPAIYIISSVLMSLAILIFTLTTVLLYAEIKKLPSKTS